ncbi:MAG: DUF115 domain-containing protein [Treponema sp.]|nr:DUF115 domain-containing protein [Treponema sp.]MCL2250820.1 DUF115 domain-containing protein [Treponema sp.]
MRGSSETQGQPFVYNGITLLSGVDPIRRAERIIDAVKVKDNTLYFCPSPIYGYGLEKLLLRLEQEAPNSVVLCIEADNNLFEIAKKNICRTIIQNKKFHLTNICDKEQCACFVRETWGSMAFRYIENVHLTGGWQLASGLYTSLCDTLRREIAVNWSNALTLTKLGRLYIRNALRNIRLAADFQSISNLSFGQDAVLVLGAGPSLDEILQELKNLKNVANRSFKIICVDTCLRSLLERNIIPDLVVILESQHWNIRDFIGCRDCKIPIAFDISALPASAHLLNGDGFLFYTPWTHLRIFERLKEAQLLPAVISPLGSVGLTAVELARKLTNGKIICSGIDFSFTQDKYHARCTQGHLALLKKQTRFKRLFNLSVFERSSEQLSKKGGSVRTNPIMKNYRNLFEQEFGADERIFDIEGTGLSLGVKTLSMKEALEILNKENKEKGENNFGNGGQVHDDYAKKLNEFLIKERKRLEEIKAFLTGEEASDKKRFNILIDECDYLWAHFPDCAGGRKPNTEDLSFLKRVRIEIDPMLRLL